MTSAGRDVSAFYVEALERLSAPAFLSRGWRVGTRLLHGIDRQTKDLDLFLRKADIERALDLFLSRRLPGRAACFRTGWARSTA